MGDIALEVVKHMKAESIVDYADDLYRSCCKIQAHMVDIIELAQLMQNTLDAIDEETQKKVTRFEKWNS